jgi:hypothetical protein
METFLWSLWDRLVLFLASLNPTTKAKVDKIKAEVEEMEARRQIFLNQLAEAQGINQKLSAELHENLDKRAALEDAIKLSKQQAESRQAELDALSDHDRVRVDL